MISQSKKPKRKWEKKNYNMGNSQEVCCKRVVQRKKVVLGERMWDYIFFKKGKIMKCLYATKSDPMEREKLRM